MLQRLRENCMLLKERRPRSFSPLSHHDGYRDKGEKARKISNQGNRCDVDVRA